MDELFQTLADTHRRQLLIALLEQNTQPTDPVAVSDAVDHGGRQREDLQLVLRLEQLESAKVIKWNRETQEIYKGPRFKEFRPLLEVLNDSAEKLPGKWA